MITYINLKDEPSYRIEVSLDGVTYFLQINYSTHGESWILTLLDSNLTNIASNIAIFKSKNLLKGKATDLTPRGKLFLSQDIEELRYDNASNFQLIYVSDTNVLG